jgi:hypothetical protein
MGEKGPDSKDNPKETEEVAGKGVNRRSIKVDYLLAGRIHREVIRSRNNNFSIVLAFKQLCQRGRAGECGFGWAGRTRWGTLLGQDLRTRRILL